MLFVILDFIKSITENVSAIELLYIILTINPVKTLPKLVLTSAHNISRTN